MNRNEHFWRSATFYAAVVAAVVSLLVAYQQHKYRMEDLKKAADKELLQERRSALLTALEVVDNVYVNKNITKDKNFKPKPWPMQKARDAINKMIIYCEAPQETVVMFRQVMGIYDEKEKNNKFKPNISDFRRQVAKELHLPAVAFDDPNFLWYGNLPGAQ